jgi:hypothetical protein
MLTTSLLDAAGVAQAKKMSKDILPRLAADVTHYNQRCRAGGMDRHERAERLHGIMYLAGVYLTLKPPQPGHRKNLLRWEAMRLLAEETGQEAAENGFLMVRGPADMRDVGKDEPKQSIWLEVVDSRHRHGANLSENYERWLKDTICRDQKKSFWEYVDGTNLRWFDSVQYGAEANRVSFDGAGCLIDIQGDPCDTKEMSTVASGEGVAIFVYGTDGQLYLGSHVTGEFHHTSFLGGKPVVAAGEMMVVKGTIKMISAKTGHYWTPLSQLHKFAQEVRPPAIADEAIVRPWMLDRKLGQIAWFLRCGDFRRRAPTVPKEGDGDIPYLTQAQVFGELPNSYRSDKFDKVVREAPTE